MKEEEHLSEEFGLTNGLIVPNDHLELFVLVHSDQRAAKTQQTIRTNKRKRRRREIKGKRNQGRRGGTRRTGRSTSGCCCEST